MKVIFLDVDGVLNNERTSIINCWIYKLFKIDMPDVSRKMVRRLSKIVAKTGAKVVMSSSWRGMYKYYLKTGNGNLDVKYLNYLFKVFEIDVIDCTPVLEGSRGDEIREWINNNNVTNFVILDDEIFSDFYELKNNLVKTEFYGKHGGLLNKHVKEAINLLNAGE